MVARLEDIKKDLHDLRDEVRVTQQSLVGRGEWQQRNAHVDTRLDALEGSKSRTWTVVAVIVAGLSLVVTVGLAIAGN
ncbi:hypothetical protein [Demequina sp. NBRC 110055]|uniref:hypothetical protein n=1 Tax=Demequina sp. NBRC 110055 TaxID=1570344 RepID=UPI001185C7C8|nr:hypothetical protein [Demequina sp. NBRC 110055]